MKIKQVKKLYKILCNFFYFKALLKGVAAGTEHIRLLQNLACRHVVDIGANCGQFALISRKCFPDARIDSFEPLAEPADRYEKVFAKDGNVHLHRLAIGEKKGEATIHVSRRDDSSSLLPITGAQTTLFPGTGERETRMIRVAPLDSALSASEISKPALLKMDVQGYEMEALRGCKSLIGNFRYIYCECSFIELYEGQSLAHEVIDYLYQSGFSLSGVYNMTYDKCSMAVQADFLFRKLEL
ncbi:MAG: FkbM family methyltransferase [Zetaproteobacteria bacterium CG12_big_fil_rev_8_21_14_0_65_55_1124]|nr:MAG: methyltransferase FkbM [Zetaproteobacteria bacterium CG1_02_55_237]PIS19705.1 MAG: FkbM family methyltransferase [Zetaproteobacteria bacterium CG08_land_8_20_14_0_20_55_17]PIW43472.1 MAG: FkbM family methyltransferase [Zetaproteobacteria bacterium CG12_big_fil_rev_8_21_14_0_65_55_1124]PIY54103.1 MAG: FkbM family methyltransferase [Zetaproteobacteria bacterium CG_4_10_14_0_8_um_filter_55_43]PIZ39096.1 MAG: FkbM family methyltransferase [Zetaproteobacteria bacterium CG_4_10_14_0_2_um_filt